MTERPALWRCPLTRKSDNVTLFREFLLDDAPGSLIAGLRARGLAEDVTLNWLYQDNDNGWLALTVDSERPEEIDPHITHWLRALQQTTDEQQRHYYRLAQQRFSALPTLEQLRQRAFGFAPGAAPVSFSAFCADLLAAPTSYLACKKLKPLKLSPARGLLCRLAIGVASRLQMIAPSRFPSTRRLPGMLRQPRRQKPLRCCICRRRHNRQR